MKVDTIWKTVWNCFLIFSHLESFCYNKDNKHFEGSCELLRFWFVLWKCIVQVYRKLVYSISVKNYLQYKCTESHLQYKCIENQFTVQMYRKPVYSTHVQKTSLQYTCTENQFTVHMCRKPVYSTCVQKNSVQSADIL